MTQKSSSGDATNSTQEDFRGKVPFSGNQIFPSVEKSGTRLFMASDFDPYEDGLRFYIDESQTG